jgi:surface protein
VLSWTFDTRPATAQNDPFVTVWDTEEDGESNDDQIIIPGTGTNYTIEWEEVGNTSNSGSETGTDEHTVTFPSPGVYRVKISGDFTRIHFGQYDFGFDVTDGDPEKIKSVEQWGDIQWETMEEAFQGAGEGALFQMKATDSPDLSNVSSMDRMFSSGDSSTMSIRFPGDLSGWDVSGVTSMERMLYAARGFTRDDLSGMGSWDVSGVTSMHGMFTDSDFNSDISEWSVSKVEDMSWMFLGANFSGDLSSWDVSSVKNMSQMFQGLGSFAIPYPVGIKGWDVSRVTDMSGMFKDNLSFNEDISVWDVSSVKNMSSMFYGARTFNQDLSSWDVSDVDNMYGMFAKSTLNNLEGVCPQPVGVKSWKTSGVTDMSSMFSGNECVNPDIGGWDVSNVSEMSNMFLRASNFDRDISGWDVSNVTNFEGFLDRSGLSPKNYDALLIGWEQLNLSSGLTFGASGVNYTQAGASARQSIIDNYNWTINDGGLVASVTLTDGSSYSPPAPEPETDLNPVGRLELTADATGATVTDVTLTTSGSNQGIDQISLWNQSPGTFDPGTALRRAKQSLDPATTAPSKITFTGVGQDIPTDATYLFVIVDLTSEAEGEIQPSLGNSSDLSLDGGTIANSSSDFPLILSSSSNPLPVELAAFEATSSEEGAVLRWRTASEQNNAGFEIQRRVFRQWEPLSFIQGSGTTSKPQTYRFQDSDLPYEAESVSYRLKQIDTDGSTSLTDTRTLKIGTPDKVAFHAPFPNPAQGRVTLRYALPKKTDVSIRIYDTMGRKLRKLQRGTEDAGRKGIQISTSDLSSGTYFVRLQAGEKLKTRRLTVVR